MGLPNLQIKCRTQVSRRNLGSVIVAERAGFEPANLFGLHAFQACALNQTTRPLRGQAGGIIVHVVLLGKSFTKSSHFILAFITKEIGDLLRVGTNWQFVLQWFVAQIANLRFCVTALPAT